MSAKRKSKPSPKPESAPVPAPEKVRIGLPITLISLLILLVVMGVVWSAPRMIGDLFISLAGGRDVAAGQLGKPDTWSFATGGRVWLNQNWGSGWLFYLVQHSLGFDALSWLKAILIALIGLFAVLAARSRKVPWAIALLAASLMMVSARSFIDLRANIMSLIFAPLLLWILYRSFKQPNYSWWAAITVGLWANMHGGFIFGLGMMFLWLVCLLLKGFLSSGSAVFKQYWQPMAAMVLAVLLAAFVNPFGPVNLIHPLVMLSQSAWLNVAEWQPIWGVIRFGSVGEFVFVIIIIIGISLWRLKIVHQKAGTQKQSWWSRERLTAPNSGIILFEVILFLVVVCMAVASRRFIPMALLLMAPVLAMQIWWLIGVMRSSWVIAILGVIILIMAYSQFDYSRHFYAPNNPLAHQGTFFEKMNLMNKYYPVKLAQFINDNQISGNIYGNWEWEGYLRWECPQLKIFIGGRAQQIYTVKEFQLHEEILTGKTPADILKRLNVHWMISSYDTRYLNLINRLVTTGKWVYIYNDNRTCLLADPSWPAARVIMEKALQNQLIFEDDTDALLSRASAILSPAAGQDHARALLLLQQAVQRKPLSKAYMALSDFIFAEPQTAPAVVNFLERELARLDKMSLDGPEGEEILNCRYTILSNLIQYYHDAKMEQQFNGAQEIMRSARLQFSIMREVWGYQ
jgi:hypothetical protein